MKKTLGVVFAAASLGLTALSAQADPSKITVGMGHDLAQTLCTRCHVIEPGGTNPPDHVGGPTFQSVANRPTVSRESLRNHLRNTHSNAMIPLSMPNPQLTEDELLKIIDYLLSLRPAPAK